MSEQVIWVHGDCLSPKNPAFEEYPNSPAVWIWDDALLEEWQIGLKRITFIYECLLELPVTIRRGDIVNKVLAFAVENNASKVITVDTPSPRFDSICDEIERYKKLEVYETKPFFDYDGFIDLKRFSRYWKVAQKHVFD